MHATAKTLNLLLYASCWILPLLDIATQQEVPGVTQQQTGGSHHPLVHELGQARVQDLVPAEKTDKERQRQTLHNLSQSKEQS
jgi:hypothetical protein